MIQPASNPSTRDCLFTAIIDFIVPFLLAAAGGNAVTAETGVRELIDAFNPSTNTELDLAGRIVGFSIAALDNLRLSMRPGLSDSMVLRYRCNAATLNRSSDQARKMLAALQAGQPPKREVPRPTIAAAPAPLPAPPAPKPVPTLIAPLPMLLAPAPQHVFGAAPQQPMDFEATKRNARAMMTAFSKGNLPFNLAQPGSATATSPATSAAINAAVNGTLGIARRAAAT